jgi:HK97 gp10 family phage protein
MSMKLSADPSFDSVSRKMLLVPQIINSDMPKALKKAAFIVEGESKKLTPVDTGRLRSSIYTTVKKLSAIVQPKTNYALAVHEGTSRMKARPFMKEGMERSESKIKRIFQDNVRVSILKVIN